MLRVFTKKLLDHQYNISTRIPFCLISPIANLDFQFPLGGGGVKSSVMKLLQPSLEPSNLRRVPSDRSRDCRKLSNQRSYFQLREIRTGDQRMYKFIHITTSN